MDEVAGELREPLAAQHAQRGMHSAATCDSGRDVTIGGQDAAKMERLIERVRDHPDQRTPVDMGNDDSVTRFRVASLHLCAQHYIQLRNRTVCVPN